MEIKEWVNLSSICEIITGQIFSRITSYDLKNSTNYKVIRESYIKQGVFELPNDEYDNININNVYLNNDKLYLNKRLARVDDIIVSLKYPFHASIVGKLEAGRLVDSYSLIIRNIDSKIDKYYLLSYLNSKSCINSVKELCNNNLNKREVVTVSLKTYKITKVPLLKSNFEMCAIGKTYKETLKKIRLFKRILDLEMTINDAKYEEIIGGNNDSN